jgi:AsmA protein
MTRAGKKILGVVVGVIGALVVLFVVLALVLQTSAVSNKVKDLVVPRASEALGRQVAVKDARFHLLLNPRVSLAGVTVAGRSGEPPLAELDAFDVRLRLWPLVRSLGKDVEIDGIRLVRPVLNLVRAADGTWNYEGIGHGEEAAAKPAGGGGREGAQPSQSLVVSHASISDGTVRLLDRARGGDATVAVSRIDVSADEVGLGRPLDASLSAAIAGDQPNLRGRVHASALPASAASLGPGRYPELSGTLALTGLDLARLRAFLPPKVTGIMTGGRVDVEARLGTEAGRYHLDGQGKLSQVRLRGEPAQGGFELQASFDPATGAALANVTKLALKGPGVDLGAHATVASPARDAKGPTTVRFAVAGPLLDLGQVMGLLPQEHQPPPKEEAKPFALTAEQRRALQGLDVQGTLDIQKVVKGALVAEGFRANAALENGAFVLREAHAGFFGGTVDAAGTRVDLAPALPAWNLKAKLESVDLGKALNALAGAAPVVGHMNAGLDLDGAGVDWPTLKKVLTGRGAVALRDGALTTTDLGGQVLGSVSQGLRAIGKNATAAQVGGTAGRTEVRDLAAQFTVKNGAMTLAKPLAFTSPFGATQLGGTIGLGGELGLEGTVTLSKEALQQIAGGAGVPLPAALQVPIAMSGTMQQPSVKVNAQKAASDLASGVAQQEAQQVQRGVEDRVKREARRGLGGLPGFGQ